MIIVELISEELSRAAAKQLLMSMEVLEGPLEFVDQLGSGERVGIELNVTRLPDLRDYPILSNIEVELHCTVKQCKSAIESWRSTVGGDVEVTFPVVVGRVSARLNGSDLGVDILLIGGQGQDRYGGADWFNSIAPESSLTALSERTGKG